MSRIALFSLLILLCQPLLAALAPASHAHIMHAHEKSHAQSPAIPALDSPAAKAHDCCDNKKTPHAMAKHGAEHAQDNSPCCDDNCQCSIGCQLSLLGSVILPQQRLAQTKLSPPEAALAHVPPARRLRPPIHLF